MASIQFSAIGVDMLKIILFGATGMIGQGALREALLDDNISKVLVISRRPLLDLNHPKVEVRVHENFLDFSSLKNLAKDFNAVLYCLGESAAGKSEEDYTKTTYQLTLAAAKPLSESNPHISFLYISGDGADSTEQGKIMWARVKGKTENALLRLPFRGVFIFRPALIQPLDGIQSRTLSYRILYKGLLPFFPILRYFFPNSITDTRTLGKALIAVAKSGYSKKPILSTQDINEIGRAHV